MFEKKTCYNLWSCPGFQIYSSFRKICFDDQFLCYYFRPASAPLESCLWDGTCAHGGSTTLVLEATNVGKKTAWVNLELVMDPKHWKITSHHSWRKTTPDSSLANLPFCSFSCFVSANPAYTNHLGSTTDGPIPSQPAASCVADG